MENIPPQSSTDASRCVGKGTFQGLSSKLARTPGECAPVPSSSRRGRRQSLKSLKTLGAVMTPVERKILSSPESSTGEFSFHSSTA